MAQLKTLGNELSELLDALSHLRDAEEAIRYAQSEMRSLLYTLGRGMKREHFILLCQYLKVSGKIKWETVKQLEADNIWEAEKAIKAIRVSDSAS